MLLSESVILQNVDIFQLNVDKFQLKYYRPLGSWSALSHHILHCQLQEKSDLGAILTVLHRIMIIDHFRESVRNVPCNESLDPPLSTMSFTSWMASIAVLVVSLNSRVVAAERKKPGMCPFVCFLGSICMYEESQLLGYLCSGDGGGQISNILRWRKIL